MGSGTSRRLTPHRDDTQATQWMGPHEPWQRRLEGRSRAHRMVAEEARRARTSASNGSYVSGSKPHTRSTGHSGGERTRATQRRVLGSHHLVGRKIGAPRPKFHCRICQSGYTTRYDSGRHGRCCEARKAFPRGRSQTEWGRRRNTLANCSERLVDKPRNPVVGHFSPQCAQCRILVWAVTGAVAFSLSGQRNLVVITVLGAALQFVGCPLNGDRSGVSCELQMRGDPASTHAAGP